MKLPKLFHVQRLLELLKIENLNDGIHIPHSARIGDHITSAFFIGMNEIKLKQIEPNMNDTEII